MFGKRSGAERMPCIARRSLLAAVCSLPFAGAARAAAAAEIRIGQVLPLTGPLGPVVRPIAEGQKLLLDAVNAQGGINGAQIRLLTLDDAAQPAATLEHTQKLLDQHGVAALFGYAFVPGLMRALPLLDERRVPLIGVYNGADNLRKEPHPWLFTTTASLRDEVDAMLQNLATLNSRRVAVAYQNNELGRFMLPQVEAIAAQHQVTLLAQVPVEPDGSNARAATDAIARTEPQAVLLLAGGAAVVGFMRALPSTRVPVYALSLAGTSALLEQLGAAARGMAFTQVVPYPLRQMTPLTSRFGAAAAAAGVAPSYDRMWGYLNASILIEVLRRAGPQPTPASIQAALEKLTELDLGGYRLGYGARQRHGSRFVEITMVDASGRFIR
ncbi:ABC transporter substrate-binding protein [Roseateles violae]|uniref:ABC transporter substrate-binding protein n=1 Tax=Roseateles violae TaxID=3058042 RepID=A0ABT8DNR7_9BURK|nr:ABC transporter substrate-binding protein [Pelomonas sp. PFR6]MDN3918688.1 ABC transporter substrate-binding protein [Pelomonas sp. PFR6]